MTAEQLGADWRARAAAKGVTRDTVRALLGRTTWQPPDEATLQQAAERLAGEDGLTQHASSFTRRDVIRGWCEQLPGGVDVAHVRALTDWLLHPATGTVVPLLVPRGDVVSPGEVERRWSTPDLLATEAAALQAALARRGDLVPVADGGNVEAAIAARPSLGADQAIMVRAVTTASGGVQVVVGKAGTGKTFALDAARDAWEASGVTVVGCALAARAAAELEAGAGIPSTTLARMNLDLGYQRLRQSQPQRAVVVFVDEAGMAGTRDLARLLEHATALQLRVVLVGDHRQLPEVNAGGLYRALTLRLPTVELTVNRRQQQPWEAAALDELRHGDPAVALAAYDAHGRHVTAGNADALRERLVTDWYRARAAGGAVVMIAATRADVADLNARARRRLTANGALSGEPLRVEDLDVDFRVGDVVVTNRNRHRLGVLNGTRGVVAAIDHDERSLTVAVEGSDRTVVLPGSYVEAGHVEHGYCVTAHKAQGSTVDAAFVLGSEQLYRQLAYVALSRGREANTLYSVAGEQLARVIAETREQELASEWTL